jgi:hypothetical protein
MNLEDREKKMKLLESYLKYPGESSSVDYKAAIPFKENSEFSHKLVKHVLGMANVGGGYIVIGYKEDERGFPQPDPQMTNEIAETYEITRLNQYVNTFISEEQKIEMLVYLVEYDGKRYPVIEVKRFKEYPFFCKVSTNDKILSEGSLYFRDSASRTIKIASPSEWKQLIDICVKEKQDYVIRQFRLSLKEFGLIPTLEKSEAEEVGRQIDMWINERRDKMKSLVHSAYGEKLPTSFWEVVHWLPNSEKTWDQKNLRDVAENSQLHNTGWPIGIVLYDENSKPIPKQDGVEAVIAHEISGGIDYWYFKTDGSYYFARTFEEDFQYGKIEDAKERILYFDLQIWRVAEVLSHCLQLYNNLKIPAEQKIIIQISWIGINNRILKASPGSGRLLWPRKCVTPSISWQREVVLSDLFFEWENLAIDAINNLFLMFDYFKIEEKIAKEIIEEFKKSKL